MAKRLDLVPYLFVAPALALVSFIMLAPMAATIGFSLYDWRGHAQPTWIGLDNYFAIFREPLLLGSLVNTIIWVVTIVAIPNTIGLLIAMMVNSKVRGEKVFRLIFFFPFVFSSAATAMMWRLMYNPSYGSLNAIFRTLGLDFLARPWLGIPGYNTLAMIVASTWSHVAFSMIIFLAGLRSIPLEIEESAKVDGLSSWQRFRHVTFPLLAPFTTVVIAITLIGTLKVFDLVYVMTSGGPNRSSETLAFSMYFETLFQQNYGYGSAISTVLLVLVTVVSLIYINHMMKREIRY